MQMADELRNHTHVRALTGCAAALLHIVPVYCNYCMHACMKFVKV